MMRTISTLVNVNSMGRLLCRKNQLGKTLPAPGSIIYSAKYHHLFIVIASLVLLNCGNTITRFLDLHAESQRKDIILQISGLSGSGLRIRAGVVDVAISVNGEIRVRSATSQGSQYLVTVTQHPANPTQFCRISNPAGTVQGEDIFVHVRCGPGSAAGEMVSGNVISSLVLTGNADIALSEIFAGSTGNAGTADATGTLAQFDNPTQIISDGENIFVLESTAAGLVRRIHIATRQVTTLGAIGGTDGLISDGLNLYATNFTTCVIRKMRLVDLVVTTVAGSAGNCTSIDAPTGPGTAARFNQPAGLAFDGQYIYIAEYSGHRIRRLEPDTGATITLAGDGTATSLNNASASMSTFANPHGLLYFNGKLFTSQFTFHAIRVIDLQNSPYSVTTLTGTGGFGFIDGPPGVAEFKGIRHLATDGTNLYVTDKGALSIRKVSLTDGNVTTLSGAENRTTTVRGTGGIGGTAGFRHPFGITAAGTFLFVGDQDDHIIRRIE